MASEYKDQCQQPEIPPRCRKKTRDLSGGLQEVDADVVVPEFLVGFVPQCRAEPVIRVDRFRASHLTCDPVALGARRGVTPRGVDLEWLAGVPVGLIDAENPL